MPLPATYRKLQVVRPGPAFRDVTEIVEVALPVPGPGEVLIRVRYAGVNASDPVASSGGYGISGLPFDIGVEAGGEVVALGEGVTEPAIGTSVLSFGMGCYAEYRVAPAAQCVPVAHLDPAALSAFIVGITASVGLHETGVLRSGETVLVTAAAGGVGSFAVQLARLAGNRVIGSCGDDAKAEWLRTLGCERVINYRREDLDAVLGAEYPQGIDVVFDGVGRRTFDIALQHLALHGRLVSIGAVSEYASGVDWERVEDVRVYRALLARSASLHGCMLPHYPPQVWVEHYRRLQALMAEGRLIAAVDPHTFVGLEAIADAVEYLHRGQNRGKVMVEIG
jgi:prostaglandin reductase 3